MWGGISHLFLYYRWCKMLVHRFLPRPEKPQHITLILASHHWLPVRFRIDVKIVGLKGFKWLGTFLFM